MNIALVILHADPMRGGAERYTIDLAAALAKRKHAVSLLAMDFDNVPENVKSVQLDSSGVTRTRRYLHMLDSLERHLDRTKYDIIHAMLPVRRCDLYHPHAGLASATLLSPIKSLFNSRRRTMAEVENRLLYAPKPPRVLCLSEYVKLAVKQHYPLDDGHMPILFNAVDLARFIPDTAPARLPGRIVALMIAQDFQRKGLQEAILALAQVANPSLVLRIIGKQNSRPYERIAQRAGVRDRIEFVGITQDPATEYRGADFFVLPTKHDPCSLVVLEALAMGLPVISTRFNGACEIMTDGVHGFVLSDPNDVDALAAAMKKMLDPQMRAKMSATCLELRKNLSYEQHLDQLIQIYQRCSYQ